MAIPLHHHHLQSRRFALTTLAFAVSSIIAGSAVPAIAQEDAELEEITVTGSRIRQTSGFTTPLPITAVTPAELNDLEPGSTIAEQLDALPQFFGNTTMENTNVSLTSTSGSSSLDLRNLSGNRTLVLFDGYRVVPSSKEGTVHVDFFPTALVRSVDVVTGGASAAYGADAVGGVTNFILDRQFEGFKFSAGTGMNEAGDGERYNFSVAGGAKIGDRLNVIGSFERKYIEEFSREANEIEQQKRVGWVTNPDWSPGAPAGVPQRLTLPNVSTTANSPYGLIVNTGTELDWHRFNKEGNALVPFGFGDVVSSGGAGTTQSMSGGSEAELYSRGKSGGISAPKVETNSAFVGLQYQVTDSFSVFGQALWGRTYSEATQIRGDHILYSIWAPTIFIDNYYLPENVRQIMRDNDITSFKLQKNGTLLGDMELGLGGTNSKRFDTTSLSTGFDWDLPFRNWHVRGVFQSGDTDRRNTFGGRWRMDRAFLAMDAVADPVTGGPVCRVQLFNPSLEDLANSPAVQGRISSRSTGDAVNPGDPGAIPLRSPIGLDNTIRDCIPFNIMGGGNMSQEALDYTFGPSPKIGVGNVEQDFAELLLDGELHEGWGYGPLGFAVGLTWREQSFMDETYPIDVDEFGPPLNDPALGIQGFPFGYSEGSSPNLHYISTLPRLSGDASVWEWFTEVNVPVWEGMVGNQQQHLNIDGAFRQSDYERSGKVDSWKVGVDYQFLNDFRLRYTLSTDVREPTFAELFDSQPTAGTILDPRFNNEEQQFTVVNGGNPNLAPEEAQTVTAGIIWTASGFLSGLQTSVDYFDVEIDGSVATYGTQRIAEECFINGILCGQIELDSTTNKVTKIYDTFQNVAQATVSGVDMEMGYNLEPNFFADHSETFSIRLLSSYIMERTDTPLDGSARDRSGTLGSPDLTGLLTANYGIGPWSFQMQGRYTDSVAINGTWIEGIDVDDNTLPSITWWNARIGYSGETANGATWRVGLNIQNLFDKQPIIVPSVSTRFGIQGLTGDEYGRRYNLNMNYNF